MAPSSPSFKKRQKERARQEKQREKAARRLQRKQEKAAGAPPAGAGENAGSSSDEAWQGEVPPTGQEEDIT